ncbi:MAG: ComF family protein [candidate division KSB1 bacterium]|nr:ComF family protein [candidate division KSB1 bacterium]
MKGVLHTALRAVLDFVLPPHCLLCRASTSGTALPWVCQSCWRAVAYIMPPLCAQCGQPLAAPPEGIASTAHRCGACLLAPPAYDRARAVGLYQGVLRDMIHAMKYQRIYGLVRPLGDLLCQHFLRYWGESPPAALVPVPLHRSKLRLREFDQALALASQISQGMQIPLWTDVLIRHRPTRSQVGLSAAERRRNIRGAFRVHKPHCCAGQALLLIDDVYTTGATVQECARLLRQAGAARVDVYTVARVG